MKQTFTKKDLLTGDIIEERNGDRGVVILEKDCILYQAGGLDELDIFTDDLFIDGPAREGDIFRVYRDPDGHAGFQKLYDAQPVFRRINNRATRERAAELDAKYDTKRGKALTLVLEPCFRRCDRMYVDFHDKREPDMALSEAPSMTALGKIKADRTFVRLPNTENLYLIYNRYQEERCLKGREKGEELGRFRGDSPIVSIPENDLHIYSRSLVVRMNTSGAIEDLQDGDIDKIRPFLCDMELPKQEATS